MTNSTARLMRWVIRQYAVGLHTNKIHSEPTDEPCGIREVVVLQEGYIYEEDITWIDVPVVLESTGLSLSPEETIKYLSRIGR